MSTQAPAPTAEQQSAPQSPAAAAPAAPAKPKAPAKPAAKAPAKPVAKPSGQRYGVFKAKVVTLTILPYGARPVIFTGLKCGSMEWTHVVRLYHPQAQEIGLSEFRGAFPKDLGQLDDRNLLVKLMTEPKLLLGRDVEVEVSPQLNKLTGKQEFNPETKAPFFNVRLRNNSSSLSLVEADAIIARMLNLTASAAKAQAQQKVNATFFTRK